MAQETFIFRGADGRDVFTRCWGTEGTPSGSLQIFHGMAEHSERYRDFAEYMNAAGFAVYTCDLRGHGRTGEINHCSNHFENDGFDGIIEDQKLLSELIKEKHPGIPHFILGHSFGSFIAQAYIKRHGESISGVILSGSCMMKGAAIDAGYLIALISLAFGRSRPNALIDKLSFGSYNKRIKNPSGKFAWLSSDDTIVKKYEKDQFCGNVMSTNFYYYFFKGLRGLYKTEDNDKIPKKLSIYIMSGEADPVGRYGKGAKQLFDWYKRLGAEDLHLKLYKDGRHEMLNEMNHEEVYKDILSWLLKHISG